MLKSIFANIKNIDVDILKIVHKIHEFSFILFIVSLYILFLYNTYPFSYTLFEVGLLIFEIALNITISGFISGFVIDKIRKGKI